MKAIYWVIGVVIVSVSVFIYFMLGDAQRTLPKVSLSYFSNEAEMAQAVTKRLNLEISQNSQFWIGVEPERNEHLSVVTAFKAEIEKINGKFDEVILDTELPVTKDFSAAVGATQSVQLKENLAKVGEVLTELKKQNKKALLITASIYSNSLIPQNQLHQVKNKYQLRPMTFSLAYFSTTAEDETNFLFRCRTEDTTGLSNWGCAVLNKARSIRRKYKPENPKPWAGLMDMTGENDYMILMKKK